MTIRITVTNTDETREVEVIPVDPDYAAPADPTRATVLGPGSTQEFHVHTSQGYLVREVLP